MYNVNGPPRGSNVTSDQSSYDIIYKDIIVKSENRNTYIYPNPNNYTVTLNQNFDKIYKAELISVNVPAATDITVNLTSSSNRLYFGYDVSGNINYGYIQLQAGTYLSPTCMGEELQRQFNLLTTGITVTYNSNLNRYIFIVPLGSILTLYPNNGTSCGTYTVTNSIASSLNLYNSTPFNTNTTFLSNPNITTNINIINNENGVLTVDQAGSSNGWYGSYSGTFNEIEPGFYNSIVSDLVLTTCNIYLSLGKMNSNTVQFVSNENANMRSNISSIFCEIPNNTVVSSSSVKTLLNQPCIWSSENFYNPPIPDLRKLEITWYNENGNLININEHCFTLRIYYLQKRNQTTAFSIPMFTYTGSGTIDSIFKPRGSN